MKNCITMIFVALAALLMFSTGAIASFSQCSSEEMGNGICAQMTDAYGNYSGWVVRVSTDATKSNYTYDVEKDPNHLPTTSLGSAYLESRYCNGKKCTYTSGTTVTVGTTGATIQVLPCATLTSTFLKGLACDRVSFSLATIGNGGTFSIALPGTYTAIAELGLLVSNGTVLVGKILLPVCDASCDASSTTQTANTIVCNDQGYCWQLAASLGNCTQVVATNGCGRATDGIDPANGITWQNCKVSDFSLVPGFNVSIPGNPCGEFVIGDPCRISGGRQYCY